MKSFQADESPHNSTKNDEGPTRDFDKEFAGHVVAFIQKVGGKVSASFEPYSTVIIAEVVLVVLVQLFDHPTSRKNKVGDTGFEPATSSTPRKRASQSAPIPDIPLSLYL